MLAVTELVRGSIRESFPLGSVTSQTASSLVAMPPSLSPGPAGTVASTKFVWMFTREISLSPQLGDQMLPKPAARPEQGRLPTVIVAAILFVFISSRCRALRGSFATQTASSVSTCQSGAPLPVSNTASGVIPDNARFTPGERTPRRRRALWDRLLGVRDDSNKKGRSGKDSGQSFLHLNLIREASR